MQMQDLTVFLIDSRALRPLLYWAPILFKLLPVALQFYGRRWEMGIE